MSYSMGQVATFVPGQPPLHWIAPQLAPAFYEERQAAGVRYRAARPELVMPMKAAMVGWHVREGADPDIIDTTVTETALLTPYNESTGPRDPGNGFRWVDKRWETGRGIVMIPPATWQPGDDLMRATSGEVRLIATENAAEMAQVAGMDAPGTAFVLYDPKSGWGGGHEQPDGPAPSGKLPKWVVPVGAGLAVVTIGAIAYLGSTRRR